jgi:cephalosporin-C deacetylase-like acetyl esterase
VSIDPDVARVAKRFGVDAALVQAVVQAEGGRAAIIKAVQCSYPSITTIDQALDIVCRSACHALSAYVSAHDPEGFTAFWGAKWAPVGAQNDPTDLNRNWPLNVLRLWKRTA